METNFRFKQAIRSWFVVLSAGLFFFYSHIELNIFNAINIPLMKEFHIDASISSELSATTLLAVLMLVPFAGMLIDRFSTRKLILITLLFSSGGIALLAIANTVSLAFVSRFLTGIGSAFCFLSCIRLASRWFPVQYMAIVVGVLAQWLLAVEWLLKSLLLNLLTFWGGEGCCGWM
ncbi:MFS transporter, aromatic acid:H+ symporter (AAHS) family (plasmid) [Piscirickettsia salmonis]|uniref:MFS transporter n=1 Tax=Piscirickettsia salmonis TaxID=1238 RepID=UPI0018ACCD0C|nr:MFS transporter [Piscirickettsia salmonis]QGP57141.1 MFS transporter, aromatic acid:H+ symporter (AAHS) family [Piscirickettsia salmonis]QGP61915.1 MFS transporter, aromatic acid:H+ symporter (AAHS) family [Piscirickettsia salmonis]QGP66689.1 MFS transporter, aromatic acid:H+ symporter (AAHS) family [Piscirickettsia salmonis]